VPSGSARACRSPSFRRYPGSRSPWFPFQRLLRKLRPGSRLDAPQRETQRGFEVRFPRFLSVPLVLRRLDGLAMALGAWPLFRRLRRDGRLAT